MQSSNAQRQIVWTHGPDKGDAFLMLLYVDENQKIKQTHQQSLKIMDCL